jgi:hypothetical protein
MLRKDELVVGIKQGALRAHGVHWTAGGFLPLASLLDSITSSISSFMTLHLQRFTAVFTHMSYKHFRLLHHWKKKFNGPQNLSRAKGSKPALTSSVKYVLLPVTCLREEASFILYLLRYLGYRNDYAHRLEGIGASR